MTYEQLTLFGFVLTLLFCAPLFWAGRRSRGRH